MTNDSPQAERLELKSSIATIVKIKLCRITRLLVVGLRLRWPLRRPVRAAGDVETSLDGSAPATVRRRAGLEGSINVQGADHPRGGQSDRGSPRGASRLAAAAGIRGGGAGARVLDASGWIGSGPTWEKVDRVPLRSRKQMKSKGTPWPIVPPQSVTFVASPPFLRSKSENPVEIGWRIGYDECGRSRREPPCTPADTHPAW